MKRNVSSLLGAAFVYVSLLNVAAAQPRGYALSFDGVDDHVTVPDAPTLDMTTGFTIVAWVYLNSYTEWASIVTKGGFPTDDNNYTIHQTGPVGGGAGTYGRLRFTGSPPLLPTFPFIESNTVIPLGEWHYVGLTYDGAFLQFYYDGAPDGGGALPGPLTPNDNVLFIGVDLPGGDEYWDGKIDEVRIWNEALPVENILDAMNGHATPEARALVGYWRFNEGFGTVAGDRSRHSNNGTLVNGPTWTTPGAPIGGAAAKQGEGVTSTTPENFELVQNYPNPFNPSTEIRFSLAEDAMVQLSVYDVMGREVSRLLDQPLSAGTHAVTWVADSELPSGVYVYRLSAGDVVSTRQMVLLK